MQNFVNFGKVIRPMLYQYICHISGLTVILRNKLKIESIPLSVVIDRSTMASSNGTEFENNARACKHAYLYTNKNIYEMIQFCIYL